MVRTHSSSTPPDRDWMLVDISEFILIGGPPSAPHGPPGSLTLLLAPLAAAIVGIDADQGMVAQARPAAQRAELRAVLQAASDDEDLFCERAREIEFDVWRLG